MSLKSLRHLRSGGPSRFSRPLSFTSVVRSRYMDIMAPHRSRIYDRAYVITKEKAGQEELATARAHRETLASEVQAAQCRVQEGESLLQSLRTEVLQAELHLRETDEHIGFIRDFLQKRKLYRLTQAPMPKAFQCSHGSSEKSDESLDFDGTSSEKTPIAEETSTGEGPGPLSDIAVLKESSMNENMLRWQGGSENALQDPCSR